jgi:hypothetical protein
MVNRFGLTEVRARPGARSLRATFRTPVSMVSYDFLRNTATP